MGDTKPRLLSPEDRLTATEWWREWCVTWYTIGYGVAMEGFDVAKLRVVS